MDAKVESPADIERRLRHQVAATLILHAIGIAAGLTAGRIPVRFAARTAGGAIAALGVVLLVTQ